MENWVDLSCPTMHHPGVELTISRSQVQHPNYYTTEPLRANRTPKTIQYNTVKLEVPPLSEHSDNISSVFQRLYLLKCLTLVPYNRYKEVGTLSLDARIVTYGNMVEQKGNWTSNPSAQTSLCCTKPSRGVATGGISVFIPQNQPK